MNKKVASMNIVKIEEKHLSLIGLTICSSKMVEPFFNSICSNNNALYAFPYFYLQCRNREIVTRILVAEVCNIERIFLESFNGLQFLHFAYEIMTLEKSH